MPCQLRFYGGSVNEIAFCTLRGSWDHDETDLQVTTDDNDIDTDDGFAVIDVEQVNGEWKITTAFNRDERNPGLVVEKTLP